MHESRSPRPGVLHRLLLVVSALGGLLFSGVVLMSFIEPLWIARAAREVCCANCASSAASTRWPLRCWP